MNARLTDLPHELDKHAFTCRAIVETPHGSRAKFIYDVKTGLFALGKLLPVGMAFPVDFGFVPSTLGGDGDALDLLVVAEAQLPVGCLVTVRLLGSMEVEQWRDGEPRVRNDRLIARLAESRTLPQWSGWSSSAADLPISSATSSAPTSKRAGSGSKCLRWAARARGRADRGSGQQAMKRLALLRHAKSSWDDPALADFDRPLNARGVGAAAAIGAEMGRRGLAFDLVLASPARRVVETLEHLEAACGEALEPRFEQRIYQATAASLLDVLRAVDESARRLLLVGHNPGLQELAAMLASPDDPHRESVGARLSYGCAGAARTAGGEVGGATAGDRADRGFREAEGAERAVTDPEMVNPHRFDPAGVPMLRYRSPEARDHLTPAAGPVQMIRARDSGWNSENCG